MTSRMSAPAGSTSSSGHGASTPTRWSSEEIARFEEQYAARSGVTVRWLHEHGAFGVACECGEDGCEGFQMGLFAAALPAYVPSGFPYSPDPPPEPPPPDPPQSEEHSDNGDDLRRLDEVLEEQRQRIVALGEPRS